MTNPKIHSTLITTGFIMWCIAYLSELSLLQPYSTLGIAIAPILTVFGIAYWFRYYRATRGHYPKFLTAWRSAYTPSMRFEFMARHLLEFWTFCLLVWMGITAIGFMVFGNSDAYAMAKNYCRNTQSIHARTGDIQYFGLLISGKLSTNDETGKADLYFTIVGEKGNFNARSKLTKQNGVWRVDYLNIN